MASGQKSHDQDATFLAKNVRHLTAFRVHIFTDTAFADDSSFVNDWHAYC